MKRYLWLFILLPGLVVRGELSEDDLKRLERDTEIANVRTDTIRNDDREKIEVIEINTFQNIDAWEAFSIRILVELQDRYKQTYQVEFFGYQPPDRDSEYTGENYWNFLLPHGDLERVKISGYVIQYGVVDDDTFYVLAEECDDVDSWDELKKRTETAYPGKAMLRYAFTYIDSQEGETQDYYRTIRLVTPGPATIKTVD